MPCYYHNDRSSTVSCHKCGKSLCTECGGIFQPPTCKDCAKEHIEEVKSEMIKNLLLGAVLMVAGLAVSGDPLGFLLAGIPFGWSFLNRITPSMFLWLPMIGWVIYFLIKLILSYFVGIIAFPLKIIQWISELNNMKKLNSLL